MGWCDVIVGWWGVIVGWDGVIGGGYKITCIGL